MTNGFVLATDPMLPPHGLEGAVYAIGNFDGLHLGHQAVIERAVAIAKEKAAPSALLTFEPHPADFFAGRPVVFRLTPPREKAADLRAARPDGPCPHPFRRLARRNERGGLHREDSRGAAWSGGGGGRVGLPFRQGQIRFADHSRRGRPEIRLCRGDCHEGGGRGRRRLLERHSQGPRARRPRRRGERSRTELFGFRPSDFGSAPGAHPWRADGEYRARADQPACAWRLRRRGPS